MIFDTIDTLAKLVVSNKTYRELYSTLVLEGSADRLSFLKCISEENFAVIRTKLENTNLAVSGKTVRLITAWDALTSLTSKLYLCSAELDIGLTVTISEITKTRGYLVKNKSLEYAEVALTSTPELVTMLILELVGASDKYFE